MKFYLVKDISGSFTSYGNCLINVRGEQHLGRAFGNIVRADILPVDQSSSEVYKCTLLKNLLDKEIPKIADDQLTESQRRDQYWKLVVVFGVSNKNNRNGRFKFPRDQKDDDVVDVLSKLVDLFEGITVQLKLSLLENEQEDARVLATISSTEMTVLEENENLFESPMLFPGPYFAIRTRAGDPPAYARVTITVTIPDEIFNERFGTVTLNQKILQDGDLADVTIVCEDETEIKAHRIFLATRSSVFMAMLQTDMKESRENVLEIPDMTVKSVRAFLKYLYYDDTKDAEEDFETALELLKAGHKYDIKCLEGKMKELILKKPNKKIDMEGAVQLFLFARNLTPADEELMKKAAKVLEKHSDTLQESSALQELFRTDHKAAFQLYQYAYKRN